MSPVSKYFNHVSAKNEQKLINDLTEETIFQRGLDLLYVPRIESSEGFDFLFGEDTANTFSKGVDLEMIMVSISEGFQGDDSIGRFGLDLSDDATFLCSKTKFWKIVTTKYPDITRPREGDLIIFKTDPSQSKSIFEIVDIQKEHPFYQIGKTTIFRMSTRRFKYTHEDLYTGDKDVDGDTPTSLADFEPLEDNVPVKEEGATLLNFDENDPFSDGIS